MAGKFGIQETKDVFALLISIKTNVKLAKQNDGKVKIPEELLYFVDSLSKLPVAITGADQIPAELADLDAEEIDALVADFGALVEDERFQRAFFGFAVMADAINEIIQGEETEEVIA